MSVQYSSTFKFWARLLLPFVITSALCIPAAVTALGHHELDPIVGALVFGLAIISAAFMLGWLAEAAELDLSGGLAIGLLAMIAILPEYVVSIYFAYAAGVHPEYAAYASANLTGSNRLLLGFGWPMVIFLGFFAYLAARRRGEAKQKHFTVKLEREARLDLGFLFIGSLLALLVPILGYYPLLLGVVQVALFAAYLWRASMMEKEEPELEGIAAYVGALPKIGRRIFLLATVLVASFFILISAEPFADYLIQAGTSTGIDKYVLVQWLAPIASEAPEFILALMFGFKGKPGVGLAILLSSKINQWTALAGSMPIAYVIGGGQNAALPMDARQLEEFSLTAAQALLGVAILLALRIRLVEGIVLFALFVASFLITDTSFRWTMVSIYAVLAIVYYYSHRKGFLPAIKAPFSKRI
ncbi:MAG: sodium:proton exchanger [Micrococcales bacterium]